MKQGLQAGRHEGDALKHPIKGGCKAQYREQKMSNLTQRIALFRKMKTIYKTMMMMMALPSCIVHSGLSNFFVTTLLSQI